MPVQTPSTIKCPKCQMSLAAWSERCQFCGTPLGKNIQRPADAYKYKINEKKTWQEVAYVILSVIMIIQGALQIAQGFGLYDNFFYSIGGGGFIGIIGIVNAGIGVALLMEQIWAQFIVKIICWLQIPFAVLGFLWIFGLTKTSHIVVFALTQTWTLAFWCFLLYIINTVGDA